MMIIKYDVNCFLKDVGVGVETQTAGIFYLSFGN